MGQHGLPQAWRWQWRVQLKPVRACMQLIIVTAKHALLLAQWQLSWLHETYAGSLCSYVFGSNNGP